MELEKRLKDRTLEWGSVKNIVMIQCVGSRDEERPYCSRVCCNQAIKNALLLKEINKDIDITVLYRDIRAYGLNEISYRNARKAGIKFIHYEPECKPEVTEENGKLLVKTIEPLLNRTYSIEADILVLSSAIIPEIEDNKIIAQMLKVPLNQDGFFRKLMQS